MKKVMLDQSKFYISVSTPLVQGDLNAYTLIYSRSANDGITGIEVEALRADQVTITDVGTVYEDRCEYTLKTNMYEVPGEVLIRVSLLGVDRKRTVNELRFDAVAEYDGNAEPADDRIPALTTIILQASEAASYAQDQGAIANAAAASATTQAQRALEAADAATAAAAEIRYNPQITGGVNLNSHSPYIVFCNDSSQNKNYVEISTSPQDEAGALVLNLRRGNNAETFDSGRIYTTYDKPINTGTYTGTGSYSQAIALPRVPSWVYVIAQGCEPVLHVSSGDLIRSGLAIAGRDAVTSNNEPVITISGSGFTAYYDNDAMAYKPCTNELDTIYTYIWG